MFLLSLSRSGRVGGPHPCICSGLMRNSPPAGEKLESSRLPRLTPVCKPRFLIFVCFSPHSQSSRKNLLRLDVQRDGWDETLLGSCAKIGRTATKKDYGSFFFVRRSPNTLTPPFSASPLTAKPVDNRGFPWMGIEIRLACGAAGRRRWTWKDEECRRGDSAR